MGLGKAVVVTTTAISLGLASCGSSEAGGEIITRLPSSPAALDDGELVGAILGCNGVLVEFVFYGDDIATGSLNSDSLTAPDQVFERVLTPIGQSALADAVIDNDFGYRLEAANRSHFDDPSEQCIELTPQEEEDFLKLGGQTGSDGSF